MDGREFRATGRFYFLAPTLLRSEKAIDEVEWKQVGYEID
jgi:hypothetical protein